MLRINIGCGRSPSNGWLNYDNSLALKLSKYPSITFILKALNLLNEEQIKNIEWNRNNKINFANASKKLPFKNDSIDVIYSSHMLEHLSRSEAINFIFEVRRSLSNGGILRISVPDLRKLVERYIGNSDADVFVENTLLADVKLNSIKDKLKLLVIGFRHHQWMYDGKSLSKLLLDCGFTRVFILDPGITKIKNHEGLNLYERSDESIYVEAIK
jgi:predicted SAM-dependent methyltransferase